MRYPVEDIPSPSSHGNFQHYPFYGDFMNSKTSQLRELLAKSEMLTITGCHDALSARLAEQAGFPAVFMSGFAVSATRQ